jgi:hypothetical protein
MTGYIETQLAMLARMQRHAEVRAKLAKSRRLANQLDAIAPGKGTEILDGALDIAISGCELGLIMRGHGPDEEEQP